MQKEQWIDGPKIPSNPDLFGTRPDELHLSKDSTCLVAVNRSTVFVITFQYSQDQPQFTTSFNILNNSWQSHSKAPLSNYEVPSNCALYSSKSQEKFIFTTFDSSLTGKPTVMLIFDIAKNQWTQSFSLGYGKGNFTHRNKKNVQFFFFRLNLHFWISFLDGLSTTFQQKFDQI